MKTWWDRFSAFVFFGSCVFIVVVLIFASMTLMSTPTSAATNELPGPVGRYQICPNGKIMNDFLMVDTCTGEVWRIACGAFGGEWKTMKVTGARP